jgi:glucose-1-phosphate thymidylyltransferase
MKTIVLAAGYATRLYPLTLNQPKALLPIGGRPMLDRVLESLAGVGADQTHVVTNARFAPHFRAWAAMRPDVTVIDDGTTSDEDKFGAIGDIAFVLERAEIDDDLVVVAGDNLFSDDLSAFGDLCRERDAPVVAVYDVGDLAQMSKYNSIETDDEGRITYFEEKPAAATSTLTGIALYFYPRHVLPLIARYIAEGNNPDQPGRLIQWLYPRTDVYTWRVPGTWYDIGSAETLREADEAFSQS